METRKTFWLRAACGLLAAAMAGFSLAGCSTDENPADPSQSTASAMTTAPSAGGTTAGTAGNTTGGTETGPATKTAGTNKPNTTKGNTTKASTPTQKPGPVSNDKIVDLSGYTFVIGSGFFSDVEDPMVAEMLDVIEETFKCKVKINFFWPSLENMQKKTASGDKVGDFVDMPADLMLQSAMAGYIRPLNEIEGINVNDARWIKGATKLSTMDNNTWGVSCWYPPGVRSCVFYNRDLVNEDMTKLVKDGKWTFDKFRELCKAATKDTNGDGVYDTFGFGFADPDYAVLNFVEANGGGLAKVQNGKVVEAFSDSKTIYALDFYNQLINEDKVANVSENLRKKDGGASDVDMDSLFINGKMAFYVTESWKGVTIRQKADKLDYGILPLPKGPSASDYVSPAENYSPLFCITSTNKDLDKSVPVLNYLGKHFAESFADNSWMDDVAKDYFQSGDDDSLEMYQYILDRSMIDPGYIVTNLRTNFYNEIVRKSLYQRDGTPAQAVKAQTGKYQKDIDAVFNK